MSEGPAGGARLPAGCDLEALLGAEEPSTGRAWDAGLRVGPCGDRGLSGVRTPGRPPWQLPGVRDEALCSLWWWGWGHRFSQARRSGAQLQGALLGDGGTSGPAWPGLSVPR